MIMATEHLMTRGIERGSKQESVFAIGLSFSIVATIVVALRVHCRLNIVSGGLGLDDYLMLAGALFNIGLSIANMVCAWYGAGLHIDKIPQENYPSLLKSNYANRLLYVFSLCLVKLSILVFYERVDPRKWVRWVIRVLMFTIVGLSVATACICVFECWPPHLYWDVVAQAQGLTVDKCLKGSRRQTFFETNGIINIVQDVVIYSLPVPMLWKLQVPRRQKAALIFLFCIGFVALVAACVRYYYVLKLKNEEDIWYYFADSLNWCSIEVYAVIICGSASTFRVLFKTYLPRLWGSHLSVSGRSKHPYNQSHDGNFALRTFGQGDSKSSARVHASREPRPSDDNNSEEAIVHKGNDGRTTQ